jgi:putative transposase
MNTFESLKHTKWECKYHIVFIPKYRKKVLYQQLRRELGAVFRDLAVSGRIKLTHLGSLQTDPPLAVLF